MRKKDRVEVGNYLSRRFFKKELGQLPTPIRILIYGEVASRIEKAQYIMIKYGSRKLEKIWETNRKVGNSSKLWNDEVG